MIRELTPAATGVAARSPTMNESRNLKVVAVLIAAMTVGGGVLLFLEAPRVGWSTQTLLMAEQVDPLASLAIELVPPDTAELAAYDCVLTPAGECRWQRSGDDVRLALVSSGGERLADEQARKLLELLGSLSQSGMLDLRAVRLDPSSDPRIGGALSPEAADLLALLQRKGLLP